MLQPWVQRQRGDRILSHMPSAVLSPLMASYLLLDISGVTGKFGIGVHNEAGQRLTVLPRECTGPSNTLFQQHKRRLYTQISPDGQYWNQIDYIFAAKDGEALYSQQKQDWELTGSDHELLIAKFRLKLKKVGKTTRPFRYDLMIIQWKWLSLVWYNCFQHRGDFKPKLP